MTGMLVAISGAVTPGLPPGSGPPGSGGPLSVVIQPNPATGVVGNTGVAGVEDFGYIEHAVAVVHGGASPISYHWQWVSGAASDLWGFTDPNVAEVWWSFQSAARKEAVYMVTVTDGLGAQQVALVTIIANPGSVDFAAPSRPSPAGVIPPTQGDHP